METFTAVLLDVQMAAMAVILCLVALGLGVLIYFAVDWLVRR